jgi:hypothetical protein
MIRRINTIIELTGLVHPFNSWLPPVDDTTWTPFLQTYPGNGVLQFSSFQPPFLEKIWILLEWQNKTEHD